MLAELLTAPWIHRQVELLNLQRQQRATLPYLLTGPQNAGQIELGLHWAQALLCLQPRASLACHHCASCTFFKKGAHPDFYCLIPQKLHQEWFPEAEPATTSGKIKPHSMVGSDIKIEAMHELLLFSYTTASLSPQKIAVIYPAEAMNTVSANAFLKSLEEPSGYTRFILCTQQRSRLLSTIISRCCQYPLQLPEVAESKSWLMTQGMAEADAEVMLRATGMRPHESLSYTQKLKIRTEQWESLPKDLQAGKIEWLLQLPKTYIVQILCKVCHDTWVYQQGGRPRFFLPSELPRFIDPKKLLKWYKILLKLAHEVPLDHELWMLNVRLQAQQALN